MNDFQSVFKLETEWDEAHSRVREYLQALGVTEVQQQDRIILLVLQAARRKHEENPAASPTMLAMHELRHLSDDWFAKVLGACERPASSGLVSWFATNAAGKWPAAFLANESPADLDRALRECEVRAAPGLQVASMVPQPFPNPLQDALNLLPTLGKLRKSLPLMAKASALLLSCFSLWPGNRLR